MMSNDILVIGSAHLDILADYNSKSKKYIDKDGAIRMSIGGTAFNIATNLGIHNYSVYLYTVLRRKSIVSDAIIASLKVHNVKTKYIRYYDQTLISGFVALRVAGEVVSAVSATKIDKISLDEKELKKAIRNSKIVVGDFNLSVKQIETIARISKGLNVPLFIASVSESKLSKIIKIKTNNNILFELFLLNALDARQLFDFEKILVKQEIIEVCNFFKSKNVIVTKGKLGYIVFQRDGLRLDYKAIPVKNIVSRLGAGDALLSAICALYVENNKLDWDKSERVIGAFIKPVLKTIEATVGASEAIKL